MLAMLTADDEIGCRVRDQSVSVSLNTCFVLFVKVQLFEFLSGNSEVSELTDPSVPSTPSSKSRSGSSQVGPSPAIIH